MVSNITLQSIPRPIQETLNKFIPTENTVIKNTTVSIKVGNHSFLSTQDHVNSAADTSSLSKLVTLCFIWLAIVIGNALVVVARRISKRKHIADFLIASLAMVDLINGFGPVTISIIMYVLHPSGFNGNYNDYLCKFYNWAATSLRLSACFLSTAMALDRVLSVQKPIYYRTKLSTQNVKGTILFIILAAIIIASMPFAGWSKVYPFDAVCSFDFGSSYAILIAVLGYVQLVIVLISYILVVHGLAGFIGRQVAMREQQMSRERELSVRRSNLFDRRKSSSGLLMLELGRFRTSKRFAKIMGVVCFLFYVSWMPIVLSITMRLVTGRYSHLLQFLSARMSLISSTANPLIYALMSRHYRLWYLFIIRWIFSLCGFAKPKRPNDDAGCSFLYVRFLLAGTRCTSLT